MQGANLDRADLQRTYLRSAHLEGASLKDAKLRGTDFNRALLMGADLTRAQLVGSNFRNANLTGADLREAYLYEAVFGGTKLKSAKRLETCSHRGPSTIDHRTLEMSGELPVEFLRGCGLPDSFIDYIPSLFSGAAIDFYSCFISYSHADEEFGEKVHDTLQDRGIRCWKDTHQILPATTCTNRLTSGSDTATK